MHRIHAITLLVLACACAKPAELERPVEPSAPPATTAVEVEPVARPSPAALEFGFVTYAGAGNPSFPTVVDKGGPAWVSQILFTDELPEPLARELRPQLEGEWAGDHVQVLSVEPQVLAAAGLARPAEVIWLLGPEGGCRARVGEPQLSRYTEGFDVIELAWHLHECEVGKADEWAPIGIVADELPAGLAWVPAVPLRQAEAIEASTWEDRHAPLLRSWIASGNAPARGEFYVRELAVPGTGLVQVDFAIVRRHLPMAGEDHNPCLDEEFQLTQVGVWTSAGSFEPVLVDETYADRQDLIGAFVVGDQVRWSVHSFRRQAVIWAPERSEPRIELITGQYHDEDTAYFGWSMLEYCGP